MVLGWKWEESEGEVIVMNQQRNWLDGLETNNGNHSNTADRREQKTEKKNADRPRKKAMMITMMRCEKDLGLDTMSQWGRCRGLDLVHIGCTQ